MAAISRFRVQLGGWPGAPGLNTFHALAPSEAVPTQAAVNDFSSQLQSMYDDLRGNLLQGFTATIDPIVDTFDVESGDLLARKAVTTSWTVNGGDAVSATSRATQAKFQYNTDSIRGNRVVRGGIFFGPLTDNALSTTGGTPTTTFQNLVRTAHDGLLDIAGFMRLAVYSRPRDGESGGYGYVQSVSVMRVPAVLRGRRG